MNAIKTNHTIVMPLRNISSPKFKWLDASKTDVRRTWRKARLMLRLNINAYQRTKHIHAVDKEES
jgi:hypothetical protein